MNIYQSINYIPENKIISWGNVHVTEQNIVMPEQHNTCDKYITIENIKVTEDDRFC